MILVPLPPPSFMCFCQNRWPQNHSFYETNHAPLPKSKVNRMHRGLLLSLMIISQFTEVPLYYSIRQILHCLLFAVFWFFNSLTLTSNPENQLRVQPSVQLQVVQVRLRQGPRPGHHLLHGRAAPEHSNHRSDWGQFQHDQLHESTELYDHSFMSFGGSFYWKLLPKYTTCLGWTAAVVLPNSPTENQNRASLIPSERVIIKLCK